MKPPGPFVSLNGQENINMIEQHDYPVTLQWTGDSLGVAGSSDGLPELEVATPPEFGGRPFVWSPEHLLVASAASCFMTTFLAIARNSKLEIKSLEVPATGKLVRGEDRRYSIERIELTPHVLIESDKDRAKTERLIHKADEVCLISRSLKSEIVIEPTIETASVSEPVLVG